MKHKVKTMPGNKLLLACFVLECLNLVASIAGEDNQFVYSGFAGSNLILDGAASITESGLLELTNGTLRLKSHAIYPTPLRFHDQAPGSAASVRSFSTSFVFGILSAYPDVSANGIAFFVAPSMNFSGAMAAQYLGLLNSNNNGNATNHVFAVELDTMQNNEFNDISDNHVGIDINSLISVNATNAGYYDDSNGDLHSLTLISHEVMQVWVDYDSKTKKINVTLAPLKMAKPVRPLLSVIYDLSKVIPTDIAYIGFSSSTGLVNSRHYVLGWSFAMNGPAPAIDIAKLPKLPREFPKPRSKVMEIVLPIATAALVLFVGTALVLLRRRQLRYTEVKEDWEVEFGPHRFCYKDLFRATEGFKNKNLLGIGGFGKVYRGVLPVSKSEIAVKRVSHNSKQGMKEFVAEIVSIGRMQHPNIVQLLGYCRRKGELLLVYEYMSNGSLDKYLYCRGDKANINWIQRLHIIKGIASGLLYLHEEWEKVVVHRDIKASNVLLDNRMNGRLGDFGLAMLYDHSANPQTSHVVGTIGYLAPEIGRTSKATTLTDIFAFGIFVLEVTSGRKPIMQDSEDNQLFLVDWVVEHWNKGSLIETVDIKLQGDCNIDKACVALKVGLLCSHPFPEARPSMRQALQYLDGEMTVPELVPAHLSFQMLALMQNEGFDSYVMSYPSSAESIHSMTSLVQER